MSDVAHPGYEGSIVRLRTMQKQVFSDLGLDGTEQNLSLFDRCVEWVAFEGTNVTIGRLKRVMKELGEPVE